VSEETEASSEEHNQAELLEEEKRKNEELATKLKYLQADFENYRRRMDKKMKDVEDFANSKLVMRLLSVLDELDLAITNAEARGEEDSLLDGIKMVYRSLYSALQNEGLQRIESVGKPFNPILHEAVERIPGEGEGEAIVVDEIRPGFLFKDQLIRPSMVKVKLGSSATPKTEAKTNE